MAALIAAGLVVAICRLVKVARPYVGKLPRMFESLLVAILTCALAFLLSPQPPVSVYKISLIASTDQPTYARVAVTEILIIVPSPGMLSTINCAPS